MNIEDRVKQEGTAVDTAGGTYNVQLYSGLAAVGYFKFFETFFQYDFVNGFSSNKKIHSIPVLVENGANWILTTAMLELVSGTSIIAHVNMSTAHPIKKTAGWAFTTGVTVTISVPATASHLAGVQTKETNINAGLGVMDTLRDLNDESLFPSRVGIGGGAVSVGGGKAIGLDAVAVGGNVSGGWATGRKSISIGSAGASEVGQMSMGHGFSAYNDNAFHRGQSGYDITTGVQTNHHRIDGHLQAYTTNATPGVAQARDETGTVVANSEWLYLDPGINYFSAIVIAVDKDNNDSKVWELKFAAKNTNAYGAAALLGTATKTVLGADAGAAAWDVNQVFDGPNDLVKFEVTGAVAKNIIWTVSYDQHNSTFWA